MQGYKSRFTNIIQSLSRLSLFGFSLFLTFTLSSSVYRTWKKRDFLRARQEQLASEIAKNQRLTREFALSQTPEFVQRVAREELGLSQPGETVVIIGSPAAIDISSPSGELVNSDSPVWRQWLRLFIE